MLHLSTETIIMNTEFQLKHLLPKIILVVNLKNCQALGAPLPDPFT